MTGIGNDVLTGSPQSYPESADPQAASLQNAEFPW